MMNDDTELLKRQDRKKSTEIMQFQQQQQQQRYQQLLAMQQFQQMQQKRAGFMPNGSSPQFMPAQMAAMPPPSAQPSMTAPPQQPQQITRSQQLQMEFSRLAQSEEWYMEGGHKNRILLALQSGLPNEIDWAFNKLVLLSYVSPDHFVLNMLPGIVDVVMEHVVPFLEFMNARVLPYCQDPNAVLPPSHQSVLDSLFGYHGLEEDQQEDSFGLDGEAAEKMSVEYTERILQICHVLRNFSFNDANLLTLTASPNFLKLLSCGLRAHGFPKSDEIRLYSLDLLENLSGTIRLRDHHDVVLVELKKMVYDADRAIVLGSLRTLAKLIRLEANEPVFADVDSRLVQRLAQLLLVFDEEMVATVLELLYHYTHMYGQVSVKIANSLSCHFVPVLLKFLDWNSSQRGPADHQAKTAAKNNAIDEYRAAYLAKWLQHKYVFDTEAPALGLKDFYAEYSKFCSRTPEFHFAPLSQLQFMTVIRHVFSAVQFSLYEGDIVVLGVGPVVEEKPQPVVTEESEVVNIEDEMEVDNNNNQQEEEDVQEEDEEEGDDEEDDKDDDYVPKKPVPPPQQLQQAAQQVPQQQQLDMQQQQQQIMMQNMARSRAQQMQPQQQQQQAQMQQQQPPQPQISSIPLTAALVLRNIAQAKNNRSLFLPYEQEIATFTATKNIHESITRVMANILFEIGRPEDKQ